MGIVRVKPLMTCELIMSHPHLVKPQQFEPDKPGDLPPPPKYNCVGIITPKQQKTKAFLRMDKMAKNVAREYFNGKVPKFRYPYFKKCEDTWEEDERTGKTIEKPGYMKGGLYMALNGGEEPVDIRDQKMKPITNASVLYPGCKFVAVVVPYGYNFRGNKGISWGLRTLQKCGEGENIAGRVNAEDYFDVIEGADDDEEGDLPDYDDDDEIDDDDVI